MTNGTNGSAAAFERGLPAVPEFEHELLSSGMAGNTTAIEELRKLHPHEFSIERNSRIFGAMMRLDTEGVPPAPSSVGHLLLETENLHSVGGLSELLNFRPEFTQSAATVRHQARTIRKKAAHRRALCRMEVIREQIFEGDIASTDLAEKLDLLASELRESDCRNTGRIASIEDLASLADVQISESVRFVDDFGILPVAEVVMISGEPGGGKSFLALAMAGSAIRNSTPVLYMDGEQSPAAPLARCHLLDVDLQRLKYWGRFQAEPPPPPSSKLVLEWVQRCETKPLLIWDSLISFFKGDENDAVASRAMFAPLQTLANAGATCLVLHHSGKSETAREFRGSSDIKAAIDTGYLLSNSSPDGKLGTLRLVPWKDRRGHAREHVLHFTGRGFEEYAQQTRPSAPELCTAVVRQHPGKTTRVLEDLAVAEGVSRTQFRSFLEGGLKSGMVRFERGSTSGKRFYLASAASVPEGEK